MIRPPDPSSPVPLFSQITEQLRWQVSTGALRPGTPLPATRDAATAWRVHRHTVGRAYRELRDAGLLVPGPGGRMVVSGGVSEPPAASPGVESFIREMLDVAATQLGLSPAALFAALRAQVGSDVESGRVCVVECSADQCADLERQIGGAWQVAVDTFDLTAAGEPPAGPLVTTLFHFDDARSRWPHRLGDIRFVAAAIDPVVRDLVEHVAGTAPRPDVALLVEHDTVAGLSLVEELEALLGPRFPVRLEVFEHRGGRAPLPSAHVVLATPAAWNRLRDEDRGRVHVVRLRYAIDRRDLGTLGVVHGWRERPAAPTRVHAS